MSAADRRSALPGSVRRPRDPCTEVNEARTIALAVRGHSMIHTTGDQSLGGSPSHIGLGRPGDDEWQLVQRFDRRDRYSRRIRIAGESDSVVAELDRGEHQLRIVVNE